LALLSKRRVSIHRSWKLSVTIEMEMEFQTRDFPSCKMEKAPCTIILQTLKSRPLWTLRVITTTAPVFHRLASRCRHVRALRGAIPRKMCVTTPVRRIKITMASATSAITVRIVIIPVKGCRQNRVHLQRLHLHHKRECCERATTKKAPQTSEYRVDAV